jgi:hypothetical protein
VVCPSSNRGFPFEQPQYFRSFVHPSKTKRQPITRELDINSIAPFLQMTFIPDPTKPSTGALVTNEDDTITAHGKRKIDTDALDTNSNRKIRQAKYDKKTRNAGVFERFVRDSVSLESITSGVGTKPLRLFDVTGFVASCETLQKEYTRGKEKQVWSDYKKHVFDAIGTIGYGVSSPVLMVNLLHDLRGRTPAGIDQMRFNKIQPTVGKKDTNKASYGFFHWDKMESSSNGVMTDYRRREKFLSKRTVREIDALGFGICRVLFPGRFDWMDDLEIQDHILLLPGIVRTNKPHDQSLHLDDKPGQILFLLHFPLCKEGMMLRVWDKSTNTKEGSKNTRPHSSYLRIPFGSYAITRGDVYHAGIYGKSGNFRFHMVVKTAENCLVSDKLHKMKEAVEPTENAWKNEMYENNALGVFAENYLALLMDKCGSVLQEDWVQNLVL